MTDLDIKIYKKLQDFGVVGTSYTIINELINMVDKDRAEQLELNASCQKLKDIEFLSFDAWVNTYYRYCLNGYIDLNTQEFKTEKQLSQIYRDNNNSL